MLSIVKKLKRKFSNTNQLRFAPTEEVEQYKNYFQDYHTVSIVDVKKARIKEDIPNCKDSMKYLLGKNVEIIAYDTEFCKIRIDDPSLISKVFLLHTIFLDFIATQDEKLEETSPIELGEIILLNDNIEVLNPIEKKLDMPGRKNMDVVIIGTDLQRERYHYLVEGLNGAFWVEKEDFMRTLNKVPPTIKY